nr:MAG: hypothetical protein 1 [Marnaviridae sp.]URG14537.1 MAG: RNA dependent RNA polymerase [Picornaviridae sp.]
MISNRFAILAEPAPTTMSFRSLNAKRVLASKGCAPVRARPRPSKVGAKTQLSCGREVFFYSHASKGGQRAPLAVKRSRAERSQRKNLSASIEFSDEIDEPLEVQSLNFNSIFGSEMRSTMGESLFRQASPYLWMRGSAHNKSLLGKYMELTPACDSLLDTVEQLVLFSYHWFRAKTTGDRLVALATFAKLANTGINAVALGTTALMAAHEYFFFSQEEELEVQGYEEVFDTLQSYLDKYDLLKTLPIFTKMYKFLMYVIASSILAPANKVLDHLRFDKVAQEAILRKYHAGPDMIHSILDSLLFFTRRGFQCYELGSITPIFHSEDKYEEWFAQAEQLTRQANFLTNPEVHGIDRFAFLADLKDCIEKGSAMRKVCLKKDLKVIIARLLSSLQLTHDLEVTKRSAQKARKAPLALLLYGGSSVGKSTFMHILFQQFGKTRGLKTSSEYRYVRNANEDHWNGMNSTQWCVVLDDIAFMNPALGVMDPSLAEMLCLVNNIPYVPAQAELADKGRTPCRPELVIGTTNAEDLNLHAYFSCPLAVARRFPWIIDIKPKRQYQHPDKPGMLETSLLPPTLDGEYMDVWDIVVKRIEPVGDDRKRQMGRSVVDKEFSSMKDFIKWYIDVIRQHSRTQTTITDSLKKMEAITTCDKCSMPDTWCECPMEPSELLEHFGEVQADTASETTLELFQRDDDAPRAGASFSAPLEFEFQTTRLEYLILAYYWFWWWVYCKFPVFSCILWGQFWFCSMVCKSRYKWIAARVCVREAGRAITLRCDRRIMKIMAATSAAVVALLGAYKLYRSTRTFAVQGLAQSIGHPPPSDPNPIPRPTYGDPMPFSSDMLSAATLCSRGQDPAVLEAHIRKATRTFRSYGSTSHVGVAVQIRGQCHMLNSHCIPADFPFRLDVISDSGEGISANLTKILVTESMVERIPELDVAIIRLRVLPPSTDLTKYFANDSFDAKLKGKYIGRDVDGKEWSSVVDNLSVVHSQWRSHATNVSAHTWRGTVAIPTSVGDCGSLLFSETPSGLAILGIHTLGLRNEVRAVKIGRERLLKAVRALEPCSVARGEIKISTPSVKRTLGDVSPQSVLHAVQGSALIHGSFVGEFRQKSKTNVTRTLLAPHLEARGFTQDRVAPVMGRKPWEHAARDMTRPVVNLELDVLAEAVDMYLQETRIPVGDIHVYDLHTAVNGAPGVDYCDKMNRHSSAGAPYKKSKLHFLVELGDGTTDVAITKEIEDTVDDMIATYHRGERVHPVYCGCPKDEPITPLKAEAGKVRIFTMAGMAHTIVTRMYLLPLIVHIQNNRYNYEAMPGIVAQSEEWEELYRALTKFGTERIIAGDYAKFDKRMPASVILATFDIMENICRRAGYTEQDLMVVRGIGYDTAFPVVDFNGELVEFYGSNPSGHALTVIVNCLANSLYMRYAFRILSHDAPTPPPRLRLGHGWSFKKCVSLVTYGDDNAMGVSEACPWFNHTAIQDLLMLATIEYTMADKVSESVPYLPIDKVDFLKRKWRWDEDLQTHVGPLAEESLSKMLMVCVQKKNISPECHALQVIGTAVREYFYLGRAEFERRSELLKDVVREAQLEAYVEDSTFPTWEECAAAYWARSEHVRL